MSWQRCLVCYSHGTVCTPNDDVYKNKDNLCRTCLRPDQDIDVVKHCEVNSVLQDLFVCGISLTSGQLVSELFPDCTRSCFSQVVLRRRGDDRIYEMRCLFVAVGPNARFIVLPHWDNMS